MSDDASNTQSNEPAQPPASSKQGDWLTPEARELVSKANNEAAKFRTEKNEAVAAHTAALDKLNALAGEKEAEAARAAAAEKELLKFRVALNANVPGEQVADFAGLLQGDSEDALTEFAQKLLKFTPGRPAANATDPSQGHGDASQGLSPGAAFLSQALRGINN